MVVMMEGQVGPYISCWRHSKGISVCNIKKKEHEMFAGLRVITPDSITYFKTPEHTELLDK